MIEELERLLAEHAKITAEEETLRQEYYAIPDTPESLRLYSPKGREIGRKLQDLSDIEERDTRPRIEEEIAELVIANKDVILAALKKSVAG